MPVTESNETVGLIRSYSSGVERNHVFYKQEQQTYGTASTTSYRFYGFSKSRSLFVLYAVMQTETEGLLC